MVGMGTPLMAMVEGIMVEGIMEEDIDLQTDLIDLISQDLRIL